MLCIAGFDGIFKELNSSWTAALGWYLDELRAKFFVEFVHPADRRATEDVVRGISGGKITLVFENRYQHRDGHHRWLHWRSYYLGHFGRKPNQTTVKTLDTFQTRTSTYATRWRHADCSTWYDGSPGFCSETQKKKKIIS